MVYRKVKAHTNEKIERNEELIQYLYDYPEKTTREAGEVFGISATMVCRIRTRYARAGDLRARLGVSYVTG